MLFFRHIITTVSGIAVVQSPMHHVHCSPHTIQDWVPPTRNAAQRNCVMGLKQWESAWFWLSEWSFPLQLVFFELMPRLDQTHPFRTATCIVVELLFHSRFSLFVVLHNLLLFLKINDVYVHFFELIICEVKIAPYSMTLFLVCYFLNCKGE